MTNSLFIIFGNTSHENKRKREYHFVNSLNTLSNLHSQLTNVDSKYCFFEK